MGKMNIETLLSYTVKIAFIALAALILVRSLILVPYPWWRYDKKISALKAELFEFRNKERREAGGRGIVTAHVGMVIASKERVIGEELDVLETKRRLFLDRVNLFLTILSIKK